MIADHDLPYLDSLPPLARFAGRVSNRLARAFPVALHQMGNQRPMISVTFDDAPMSSYKIGAPIVEQFGGRATYYVTSGMIGESTSFGPMLDAAALRDLDARGHEIGMHTHTHTHVHHTSRRVLAEELVKNRAQLAEILPGREFENFAYPYGQSAWGVRGLMADNSRSSRVVRAGCNAGRIDLHHLACVEVGDPRVELEWLVEQMQATVAQNGWLILMTHDVSETPTFYGTTPARLIAALAKATDLGLDCVTVREALNRSGVPSFHHVAA